MRVRATGEGEDAAELGARGVAPAHEQVEVDAQQPLGVLCVSLGPRGLEGGVLGLEVALVVAVVPEAARVRALARGHDHGHAGRARHHLGIGRARARARAMAGAGARVGVRRVRQE